MGIQLNLGDHISPFPEYMTIPGWCRPAAQWARTRARAIARGMPSADVYFRSLRRGRSLTALLADSSIWVNYAINIPGYGESTGDHEIAISPRAFRNGRWTVLATLIHELAHLNGASGNRRSHDAEKALIYCGLGTYSEFETDIDDPKTPYNPYIRG